MQRRNAKAGAFLLGLLPALAPQLGSQPLLRISLENTPAHVQVLSVERFARDLRAGAAGRLRVEVYPEARLYRDRDVVAALAQGKVEMAVPGTWQLDRFEPAVGALLLPAFYGRSAAFVHQALAGPLGREIDRRLETSTGTVVLGRWLDLGPVHVFGVTRQILRHEDLAGLRIRIAGGVVNDLRLRALGAVPVLIPWPELPVKLDRGAADGVLTSCETVASARLWEHGVRFAFEDSEYFGQYVPLLSPSFWKLLPEDLRRLARDAWERQVDTAREEAARAQGQARETLLRHGVQIATPPSEQQALWRRRLALRQEEMARSLGLAPELLLLLPEP